MMGKKIEYRIVLKNGAEDKYIWNNRDCIINDFERAKNKKRTWWSCSYFPRVYRISEIVMITCNEVDR